MDQDSTTQHRYQDLAVHKFLPPAGMSVQAFQAMGTTVSVIVPEKKANLATTVVQQLFSEWEQTLSRFRSDSELSRCNQSAGRPFAMSALLYTVLTTALIAAQDSRGIYDPAMLNQMEQLGYNVSFDQVEKQQPDTHKPLAPGGAWRQIIVDRDRRQVTMPANVKLDFGGIAKGMAVDAAIARLREYSIENALVNAGGDLAVTGLPPDMDAWIIAIPGKSVAWSIPLQSGAMATSSRSRPHRPQGKVDRHHIIDPRTGEKAKKEIL